MTLRSACILLAFVFGSASTAQAQYFGQNKVQYEKFDFKVKKTEHFDIYYYPEEEAAVELAAAGHPVCGASALPADQRDLGRNR